MSSAIWKMQLTISKVLIKEVCDSFTPHIEINVDGGSRELTIYNSCVKTYFEGHKKKIKEFAYYIYGLKSTKTQDVEECEDAQIVVDCEGAQMPPLIPRVK